MTISVWRYSHLALAVSSFLFIALAAITGFILAFKPVSEKMPAYRAKEFDKVTLAQALPALRKAYPGATDITVDANQFVTLKGTDADNKKINAYVDPTTGKILGNIPPTNEFFQWTTSLHRSLFLHELGRGFMGVTAFLLMLIAVSGTVLIIQRQQGVKHFFKKIVNENFAQYWHVVLGRLMLIPIILISLTGTYLSLSRFHIIPEFKAKHNVDIDNIKEDPQIKPAEFPIFKQTLLADVQSVEFPFSDFPEDHYKLKLKDREVIVNQFTGELLTDIKYPTTTILAELSLDLHTGRTNAIWAVVLAIGALNILFFIWSGFVMTFKRLSNKAEKNKFKADEAEYIILVGSESGTTFRYANALSQELIAQGKSVYLTELDKYGLYPKANHLVVMTSTYGLGDAPPNATKFTKLLPKYPQKQKIQYSVLGFGSHAYPDFCQFAFEVNQLLSHQEWAEALTDIHTVNDKEPSEIALWAEAWSQQTELQIDLLTGISAQTPKDLKKLTVTTNTATAEGETFRIRLKTPTRAKVTSGDLLAIYPANDHRERLYSIGVVGKEIQLSVRLHPHGLGSSYLHGLEKGRTFKARIVDNPHFHFPEEATSVVMISNGTGIAPFLGMISQNDAQLPIHLYCGFRESASFEGYKDFLAEQESAGKLAKLNLALSREGNKQYVSHQLEADSKLIAQTLQNDGILMICGSLSMQKDVLNLLEKICTTSTDSPLSYYQSHGRILMDCY
ncbi:PepSY domain-containing protein [Mucilaginibacter myungsuensis]|uniref:PepSY domain-containing protein n=1 Tax=Mucilaginibacter myungsuensis TaxID=649104 RepID=A0A929L3K6_9SPHI|nr:PepSY domain-containing protein [Mucilaginibacter myungsuensis]MBE9663839.1 PepSY domain-containing protein [Mucilaginibacter myungsuensis]MDN3598446.1 PepSY domain-containing protein [Mucilaginibacter myungsuensis]